MGPRRPKKAPRKKNEGDGTRIGYKINVTPSPPVIMDIFKSHKIQICQKSHFAQVGKVAKSVAPECISI